MISYLPKIAKALVALLMAFSAGYVNAASDGHVTSVEWVTVIVEALVGGITVWAVPNAKSRSEKDSESKTTQEDI